MIRWIGWDVELERAEHDEDVIYWESENENDTINTEDIKHKKVHVNPL